MSENIIKYNARVTQKRDTEANWNNAVNFIPLRGEIIVYEIDNTHATPRFKVGDGVTTIVNLPFSDNTISGTVTKEIGGISKNTVYTDASIVEILTDLLFPYVAFSFTGISTTESTGTLEYGTTRTISKVTPKFTLGSKPITSVKIGATSGGDDLYTGTTATNNTAITLTNSITFDGTTGGGVYCTLSDGETSLTKSAFVSYAYYTYYAVTDSTDTPTSWTPVGSAAVTDIAITANAGQYIWIASSGNYTGICELNELSGKYNSAAETTKTTGNTIVNSKNYTCENKYNFYRLTSARSGSGSSKFKLA